MKTFYKALAFLSCAIIFGCTNNYKITELKNPHDSTPIYGNYTLKRPFGEVKVVGAYFKTIEEIKRDFYSAPLMAQFSVSKIRISHEEKDKDFSGGNGGGAHFHLSSKRIQIKFNGWRPYVQMPGGKICINLLYYNGLLRHEMSHAQVFFWKLSLQEIAKLSKEKYNYAFWKLENREEYPKNGFLYRYSTKDEDEETAGIVDAISNFFFDIYDPHASTRSIFLEIDKKDERYLKKIEAVHKLGLTTDIEHKKILEFFEKR